MKKIVLFLGLMLTIIFVWTAGIGVLAQAPNNIIDISGEWKGTLTQPERNWHYYLVLRQNGTLVRGTAILVLKTNSNVYVAHNLSGVINSNQLVYDDIEIAGTVSGWNWCTKNVILNYTSNNTSANLDGTWSDPGCNSGTVTATKINPSTDPAPLTTTFNTSVEGWTTYSDATNFQHISTNGNFGGHVCATDLGNEGTWYFEAPQKYLGNLSGYYGGTLSYDLKQSDTTSQYTGHPEIVITNGTDTLEYDQNYRPTKIWTSYSVPVMVDKGWTFNDEPATEANIRTILANVTTLRIRAEFRDGADTDCLDSVSMNAPATTVPAINQDGDNYDVTLDCNDNDATIYPGAPEIPNDGIDQDCNGADLIEIDTCPYKLVDFDLIEPLADTVIGPFTDGMKIDLNTTPLFTIRANTNPAIVGSVLFRLQRNGSDHVFERGENISPYSLTTNNRGDYRPPTPDVGFQVGTFSLKVTVFSEARRGGKICDERSMTFEIIDSYVPTSLTDALNPIFPPSNANISGGDDYQSRFQWRENPTAEWYHVYIAPSANIFAPVLNQWFAKADVCQNGTCALPASSEVWLFSTNYTMWLGYWSGDIRDNYVSTYGEGIPFSVNMGTPAKVSNFSPSGSTSAPITLQWDSEPNTLWYNVWFGPADYTSVAVFNWYRADEICLEGNCSIEVPGSLTAGTYEWWMQQWGPGGMLATEFQNWYKVSDITIAP